MFGDESQRRGSVKSDGGQETGGRDPVTFLYSLNTGHQHNLRQSFQSEQNLECESSSWQSAGSVV